MSEDLSNEVGCPICGRPMTFKIVRRAFAENLYAFECKPCALSVTEPETTVLADRMRARLKAGRGA